MSCDCCGDNSYALTSVTGSDGLYGGYSSEWKFEASVAAGATAGYFRFNNATLASVTEIYISDTNSDAIDVDKVLDSFANGSVYGVVRAFKEFDPTIVWYGTITNVVDNGTYHTLTVTWVDSNGTFTAPTNCVITFTPRGTTGATGTTGTSGTAGKGIIVSWASDADIQYTAALAKNTYTSIGHVLWPGSTAVGTVSVIKFNAWSSNAANAASFQLYDVTNALVICEQTGVVSTSVSNIITPVTQVVNNVSSGAAIWQFQAKNAAAADAARVASITIY